MADMLASGQGNKTVVMLAYSPVTIVPSAKVGTSRSPEGSSSKGKARIGRDSKQSEVIRTLLNGVVGNGSTNMDEGSG